MSKKITHEQLLAILCVFGELCGRNDILYTLHGGTLLGAVREHGFIPWDDDVDVAMTRAEFNRLEAVLRESQSKYYIRGNIKKQFCEAGNPNVWVDIFICDYISENSFQKKTKRLLLTALDAMSRNRESVKLSNFDRYSKSKRMVYKAAYGIGQIVPKSWTVKAYGYVSEKCFLGNKQHMFRSNDQYIGRELSFPTEWMEQYVVVTFEDQEVSILANWHPMLVQCYGETYMQPRREKRNEQVHEMIRSEQNIKL